MPVGAAEAAERAGYGRFPERIERYWSGRWCHLSEADIGLSRRRTGDVTRLGFAVQLVSIRAVGTFLAARVPFPHPWSPVARWLDVNPGILTRYGKLAERWKHTAESQRR